MLAWTSPVIFVPSYLFYLSVAANKQDMLVWTDRQA